MEVPTASLTLKVAPALTATAPVAPNVTPEPERLAVPALTLKAPVKPAWLAVIFSVPAPMRLVAPPPVMTLDRLMTASAAAGRKLVELAVVMPPEIVRVEPASAPMVAAMPACWVIIPE